MGSIRLHTHASHRMAPLMLLAVVVLDPIIAAGQPPACSTGARSPRGAPTTPSFLACPEHTGKVGLCWFADVACNRHAWQIAGSCRMPFSRVRIKIWACMVMLRR